MAFSFALFGGVILFLENFGKEDQLAPPRPPVLGSRDKARGNSDRYRLKRLKNHCCSFNAQSEPCVAPYISYISSILLNEYPSNKSDTTDDMLQLDPGITRNNE